MTFAPHKCGSGPERNLQVSIADADYEMTKAEAVKAGKATTITIRIIERRNKIRAGSLKSYRANHYSRRKAP